MGDGLLVYFGYPRAHEEAGFLPEVERPGTEGL